MSSAAASVTYEQPLTERVRTFLRLEFLFAQHAHHRNESGEFGARATLQSLLDILVVLSRTDLKNEILKELSDQHGTLTRLAAKPGVDPERLQSTLAEIAAAQTGLQQLTTQFAATALRGHDFLISVLNRSTVPGGTCGFDLPTYHFWLSQPDDVRRDLTAWYAEIKPFEQAIAVYLKMLRRSVAAQDAVARAGMYVHTPQGACSLLRVTVPQSAAVYPEISAGKHRFSVRFMSMRDVHSRPHQAAGDITFSMQCCNL